MCHGLILLFDSTSYTQTHCIKSASNQAVLFLLTGQQWSKVENFCKLKTEVLNEKIKIFGQPDSCNSQAE